MIIASPFIWVTKAFHLEDDAGALAVKLTAKDIVYLEDLYLPHRIMGAIDNNPADGVMLLDEKKQFENNPKIASASWTPAGRNLTENNLIPTL